MRRSARRIGFVILLGALCPLLLAAQPAPGWTRIDLPTGSFFDRYIPTGVDASSPTPLIVFLHGAGADPLAYRSTLEGAADELGVVLALPKASSDIGWGAPGDANIVTAAVADVRAAISLDENKISISGHSAGGAFAITLAFAENAVYAAAFSMGAPFQQIESVDAETWVPPVRMYYGEDDPNHETALPNYRMQWEFLEVPFEVETQPGQGHNDLPTDSVLEGFRFLARTTRGILVSGGCLTGAEELCLGGGRFRVTVAFQTPEGEPKMANVAGLRSDNSGLFWFFNSNNWELLVKVLDGCEFTNHFWVFSAASTNLEYTLTVEDLLAETQIVYTNPQGQSAPAINDTAALATCAAGEVPSLQLAAAGR